MYEDLRTAYEKNPNLPSLRVGGIMADTHLITDGPVNLVLKSLNRHGLIAGATGSGKTKSIQVLCEQLSLAGVPSLVMDIKGDISGLAVAGETSEFIEQRCQSLGITYTPRAFAVEILTLNENQPGVPLRSGLQDFGPLLFSRMLDLNDTQSGVITILFEYAKACKLPLIDLADIKALLRFAQSDEGKAAIASDFGAVAGTSVGTILRNIIDLEAQGGAAFFGEPAFDVLDLLRCNNSGQGIISILRLMDMQDKPKLFSTFMLKLLTDIYRTLPELGDPAQPKLVLFIDEAHLIFKNATKALSDLLESTIKLIRSKGVGIYFCTQIPDDVPDVILSQLGLKVQHALRAFTAKDRTAMKLVARNFPPSPYYDTEQLLTSLGIGEALLSSLDAKGQPTPLVQCLMRPPESRMGVITERELDDLVEKSMLYRKYKQRQDRQSAKEILSVRTEQKAESAKGSKPPAEGPSMISQLSKNTLFRQILRDVVKTLLSIFKTRGR